MLDFFIIRLYNALDKTKGGNDMTLGDIIKEYRTESGLSQDVIADRSGLSKAYISILERNRNPKTGEPPVVSIKTVNLLALP